MCIVIIISFSFWLDLWIELIVELRQNCYYCCCYFHPSCSLSSGYNIDASIKLPLVHCIEKQLYCLLVTLFTLLCLSLLNFPHNRIWLGSWRVFWLRKYTKSCKNFRLTPATPAFCAGQQRRNDDTHSFLNCLHFLSLKTCKELVNFHNELIKSCCYCPCCYYCAHAFYPTKFRKKKTTKKAGERHSHLFRLEKGESWKAVKWSNEWQKKAKVFTFCILPFFLSCGGDGVGVWCYCLIQKSKVAFSLSFSDREREACSKQKQQYCLSSWWKPKRFNPHPLFSLCNVISPSFVMTSFLIVVVFVVCLYVSMCACVSFVRTSLCLPT